jgi:hypothetical protein
MSSASIWWPLWESNPHGRSPRDFKSLPSTNSGKRPLYGSLHCHASICQRGNAWSANFVMLFANNNCLKDV